MCQYNKLKYKILFLCVVFQDYCLVTEIINNLITSQSSSATKRALYSTLGRICLQLGDIQNGEKYFANARAAHNTM